MILEGDDIGEVNGSLVLRFPFFSLKVTTVKLGCIYIPVHCSLLNQKSRFASDFTSSKRNVTIFTGQLHVSPIFTRRRCVGKLDHAARFLSARPIRTRIACSCLYLLRHGRCYHGGTDTWAWCTLQYCQQIFLSDYGSFCRGAVW